MTDTDYWGKGYARIRMEKIMQEYEDRTDGMFLYAYDSVLEFYLSLAFMKNGISVQQAGEKYDGRCDKKGPDGHSG